MDPEQQYWIFWLNELRPLARSLTQDALFKAKFDASDLLAETLLKASNDSGRPAGESLTESQRPYFARIMRNAAVDLYRQFITDKRNVRLEVSPQSLEVFGQKCDESSAAWLQHQADGPSPSEDAAQRELEALRQAALRRLPEDLRAIMEARDQGLSLAEIAEQCGLSKATVGRHIRRANQLIVQSLPSGLFSSQPEHPPNGAPE